MTTATQLNVFTLNVWFENMVVAWGYRRIRHNNQMSTAYLRIITICCPFSPGKSMRTITCYSVTEVNVTHEAWQPTLYIVLHVIRYKSDAMIRARGLMHKHIAFQFYLVVLKYVAKRFFFLQKTENLTS